MTNNDKARAMFDGAAQCASDYRNEGNTKASNRVISAFAGLSTESAARLYDIITQRAPSKPHPFDTDENIGSIAAD